MLESGLMHPAIPRLIDLQGLDQRLAALRSDLEGLPKRLKEAEAQLTGAKAAVAKAKEAHTQELTLRKKLELDAEQWKERAKKYRAQSSSVKTNEAYKALQQEIANAEAEASRIEDQVLEQMMALEELERGVKHADADLREAEQATAGEKKKIETQFAEQKKQWESANAERQKLAASLPEDLLVLYTRVDKKHPGSAMSQARDGQCRACGMRVLPHTEQLLKSETDEEVFRCETCGRILYTLEPMTHITAPGDSPAGAPGTP